MINMYGGRSNGKINQLRTGIYLYIRHIEKHFSFFKYFNTEFEKDKFKRKLKYIPYLELIEDSSDMNWRNS